MSQDAGQERTGDASTNKAAAAPRLFTKYVAGLTARSRVAATPPECRRLLQVVDDLSPIKVQGMLLSSRQNHNEGGNPSGGPSLDAPEGPSAAAPAEMTAARGAGRHDGPNAEDLGELPLDDLEVDQAGDIEDGPPIWEVESAEAGQVSELGAASRTQGRSARETGRDNERDEALEMVRDGYETLAHQAEERADAAAPSVKRKSSARASRVFMAVTAAAGLSITALAVSVQEAQSPASDQAQARLAAGGAVNGAAADLQRLDAIAARSPVDVAGVLAALRQAAAGRGDVGVLASLDLDETGAAAAGSGAPIAGFAGLATFKTQNGCRQRREVAFEAAAWAPSGFLAAMGPVIDEVCNEQYETGSIRSAPSPMFTPAGMVGETAMSGAVLADFTPAAAVETAPIETEMLSPLALANGSLSSSALTDLISRLPVRCVVSGGAARDCAERTIYAPDEGRFTIIRPLEAGGLLEMQGEYQVRGGALCHQSVGLSAKARGGGLSSIEAARLELKEEAAFAVAAGRELCHRFTPKPAMGQPDMFVAEAFVDGEAAPDRSDPRPFQMRPMEIASEAGS